MSGNFTYPGVYIQEVASPVHTISGVATAITAFVGVAERGPVNEPVSISSVADYQRAFGGTGASPLDIAVSLFYQNGGGDAIVVRVASSKTPTSSAPQTIGLANVSARSPGAWGDRLSITVDQTNIPASINRDNISTGNDRELYNITVTEYSGPGKELPILSKERYIGVKFGADSTSPNSLQRILANSNLLSAISHAPAPTSAGGATPPPADLLTLPLQPPGSTVSIDLEGGAPETPAPTTEPDLLGDPATPSGIYAVAKHDTFFNLLVLTPVGNAADVSSDTLQKAATFALDHRAMLIADAPAIWSGVAAAKQGRDDFFNGFGEAKSNVAIYFPRITVNSPTVGVIQNVGPSAAMAGIYANTDANRGVWKAPAGITAQLGGADLSLRMSDSENGKLNPLAINCLRSLPVIGNVVWGARTAAGDDITGSQWKYVPIRRLALFIEESLYRGTQWVVFEPNDEPLWAQVRLNVGAFMHTLFRQGAFQGTTAKDAYFVKCDSNTNPQVDIDNGILNVIVGFAPLKPAEFVVIKIQQIAGSIEV